jgi:hypothetical protein
MVSKPMPATVKLKDIVEVLEMQFDHFTYFVDLDSGAVEAVSKDLLRTAEELEDDDEEPDLPAWQAPEWELAERIFSTGRFQHLPSVRYPRVVYQAGFRNIHRAQQDS